ncbi:hypothetical protein Cs7R123_06020 [Catellatospora sp. TT07R-123]|nr:hypothetical protein Cs7R123_06020 [Catellatospora sp. TT07R-123]
MSFKVSALRRSRRSDQSRKLPGGTLVAHRSTTAAYRDGRECASLSVLVAFNVSPLGADDDAGAVVVEAAVGAVTAYRR